MNNIASYIDHTLLKATATEADIEKLCAEAREYGFASVCVNPCFVPLSKKLLEGSSVKVCTVIGFPLGANTTSTKCYEAREAVANGAAEVDMVINVGKAKEKDFAYVEREIFEIKKASVPALLKVIIETCYLDKDEIVETCLAAKRAGADYVKTSTGFGTGGAKEGDVALMAKTVAPALGVKASGGIHDKKEALAMIAAGATRIGASSGVKIVNE